MPSHARNKGVDARIKMVWGGRRGNGTIVAGKKRWSTPMPQPNDLSRSLTALECCWSSDAAAHAYSLDKAMKMYARIRSLDHVAAMLRD